MPLRVLVVDDQPRVRYLLDILLREAGHIVSMAKNGMEAIEKAKTINPDLILMDVRMPLMGGLEALEHINALGSKAKVVIMTAYESEETINRAMEAGALFCITKPFDVEKIKLILNDLDGGDTFVLKNCSGSY
jgi:two-component system response regulator (stage 0 sporulation protein F)